MSERVEEKLTDEEIEGLIDFNKKQNRKNLIEKILKFMRSLFRKKEK